MSYDLYIGDRDFNYTWNLGDFFRDFIKEWDSKVSGLEVLHGKTGKHAAGILSDALHGIKSESHKRPNGTAAWGYFSPKYDPDNYWGDVMSATLFIAELYIASVNNPRKRWRYST